MTADAGLIDAEQFSHMMDIQPKHITQQAGLNFYAPIFRLIYVELSL